LGGDQQGQKDVEKIIKMFQGEETTKNGAHPGHSPSRRSTVPGLEIGLGNLDTLSEMIRNS
jgi:hypothetical protein